MVDVNDLIKEKSDLDLKIQKLDNVNTVTEERILIQIQKTVMELYSDILHRRIDSNYKIERNSDLMRSVLLAAMFSSNIHFTEDEIKEHFKDKYDK